MILLAQQNGAGPIVSLNFGANSAPASLAGAPVVETLISTDFLFAVRSGALVQFSSEAIIESLSGSIASAAGSAAVAAVAGSLSSLSNGLSDETVRAEAAEGTLTAEISSINASLSNLGSTATGTLSAEIAAETSRAEAAEGTLTTAVGTLNASVALHASSIGSLTTDFSTLTASIGEPSGIAPLDANGHVPISNLPPAISAAQSYLNPWNAASNTPSLSNASVPPAGELYVVSVAGSTTLGSYSTWNVGDQVVSNGSSWTRIPNPYGALIGSMALQSSGAVTITGGSITGISALGLGSTDSLAPSTMPDTPWFVADANNNIAIKVSFSGVFSAGIAQFTQISTSSTTSTSAIAGPLSVGGGLSVAGSLSVGGSFAPASLQLGGDVYGAQIAPMPDYVWYFYDQSYNISVALRFDGALMAGKVVTNSLTVAGNVFTGTTTPSDAVTLKSFGAAGDGIESYAYASTSGGTLTLTNFSGAVTLTQISAAVAQVSIAGVFQSGWAFQPYMVGQWLYLSVGSYTLMAQVVDWQDGENIFVAASAVTAQNAGTGTVTCPAFTADRAGKELLIDAMGVKSWFSNSFATKVPDNVTPVGQCFFAATIVSVVAGNQVTISGTFPFAWSSKSAHLVWGTNDALPAVQAAQAALSSNKRKIFFGGDGALYLLLGLTSSNPDAPGYLTQVSQDAGALLNGVMWYGDNARVLATDAGYGIIPRVVCQAGSDADRSADKRIYGRGTLKRASQLSTIILVIYGDSQSNLNPQKQAAAYMQVQKFIEEFRRANPGKTIKIYLAGVGGATWAQLANPNYVINNASNPVPGWTIPTPFAHSWVYANVFENANQTGSGSAIVPDVAVFLENGGNDGFNIDAPSLLFCVNSARNAPHTDGFGPTDIIMQTDAVSIDIQTTNSGNDGGSALPSATFAMLGDEYAATLHRTIAQANGYGLIDMAPLVYRAAYGFDPERRYLRFVPGMTATVTPALPMQFAISCRHFTMRFSLPNAAGDAAAWAAIQELDFAISPNPGNRVMLRLGPNGNIWVGVSTWGMAVPSSCTIAANGTSLTVGAPTTLTAATYTSKTQWRQLYVAGTTPFAGVTAPACLVAPLGDTTGGAPALMRSFITEVLDNNDVLLSEYNASASNLAALTGNISFGGIQFIPQDTVAQPDVTLFYSDGTIFSTQVAAYVSPTQATLAAAAPEALAGVTIQAFIGRMSPIGPAANTGPKWVDTGVNVSSLTTQTGTWEIDVNKGSLILSYASSGLTLQPVFDCFIERFGTQFYPTLMVAQGSQQIAVTDAFVDIDKPYLTSVTPWEIRGVGESYANQSIAGDYFLSGVGGHPSSALNPTVLGPLYATGINLCTY